MIKLNDVCFAYDDNIVLNHFNFEVKKGEFVIIKGDNGCGKSTLLNILNGLVFCDKGNYIFDNKDINEKSMKNNDFAKSFHQKIGYVFQNTDSQLFCSSVEEEIAFAPNQMGKSESEINRVVNDLITMLNIENLQGKAPYHLSMGEKKKVALASVLAQNPQVLVLDEPMNFLDKKSQKQILELLNQLKSIKTIIIVSHSDEFDSLADFIIDM